MRSFARFGIVCLLWVSCCTAAAESPVADQEATKKDLLTALILEGHACGAVVSFEMNSETDHVAECENGQRYRLSATEAGTLKVVALVSSPVALLTPVLKRLLLIGRSVSGLLHLAGSACGSVLGVESDGAHGQVVSCEGGLLYRIVVGAGGRVEVVADGGE